jgi:hypothetical protein
MGAGLRRRGASGAAEQHVEGSGDVASLSQQERRDHKLIGGGSDATVTTIVTESRLVSSRERGRRERVKWWGDRKLVNKAARRQAYAQQVLDAFARELKVIDDNSASAMALFQSSVLTPILQRQKAGLPDAYSPTVHTGIKQSLGPPTITEATIFYLGEDPTIPELIPYYWRNLLYIPEALWHLGIVIGSVSLPDPDDTAAYYSRVMEDHDSIMAALTTVPNKFYEDGTPHFTRAEIVAILLGGTRAFLRGGT